MPEKDKTTSITAPESTAAQTAEIELKSAGQRRINIMWEVTQSIIALVVTGTAMFTASILALRSNEGDELSKASAITAFLLISNTVFLVIGFYFGRTNHQKMGGVGPQSGETR